MAIMLRIEHIQGLRLRQQMAQHVSRTEGTELSDGIVLGGKEWRFEKQTPGAHDSPDRVLQVDVDPRTKRPMNEYTGVTISTGLKNLVIDKPEGKVAQVPLRNSSVRNQLRIRHQSLAGTGRKNKDGADILTWKDVSTQYVAPQTWGGFVVGEGSRAILDECPT